MQCVACRHDGQVLRELTGVAQAMQALSPRKSLRSVRLHRFYVEPVIAEFSELPRVRRLLLDGCTWAAVHESQDDWPSSSFGVMASSMPRVTDLCITNGAMLSLFDDLPFTWTSAHQAPTVRSVVMPSAQGSMGSWLRIFPGCSRFRVHAMNLRIDQYVSVQQAADTMQRAAGLCDDSTFHFTLDVPDMHGVSVLLDNVPGGITLRAPRSVTVTLSRPSSTGEELQLLPALLAMLPNAHKVHIISETAQWSETGMEQWMQAMADAMPVVRGFFSRLSLGLNVGSWEGGGEPAGNAQDAAHEVTASQGARFMAAGSLGFELDMQLDGPSYY